jgi:hypothetical protein
MAYNTIKLKKYTDIIEEYEAVAAIYPGHLLEITSAGKVQKHSGAGKTAPALFALEDELQGHGIGIAGAYAAGDKVQVWVATPGEQVYARQADEESLAIGDFVESNGSGQVRKVTRTNESWESADSQQAKSSYDRHIVGQVLVASDTTGLDDDSSELRPTEQYVVIRIL